MTGIIETWHAERAYGLIRPLIGLGPDTELVFCHITGIVHPRGEQPSGLPKGCEVRFDIVRAGKGKHQAINVRPVLLSGDVLRKDTQRLQGS